MTEESNFEPLIVGIFCNWCTYTGTDQAGTSRMQRPANVRIIRVMCSARADPEYALRALNSGVDGVIIGCCHLGDCHYIKGNYYARRRIALVKELLEYTGLEPERFQMSWVSAAEGKKYTEIIKNFVEILKPLGPQKKLRRSQ